MNRIFFAVNSVLFVCLAISSLHTPSTPTTKHTLASSEQPEFPGSSRGLQAAQATPGIQVNSLPHPFNLNGSMPYQVWVNGERLPLRGEKTEKLIELLDLNEFEQPEDTAEIHSGAGWLRPFPVE